MSKTAIEQLVFMMDSAFEGDPQRPDQSWNALVVNLKSVRPEDWDWIPPDGRRTIRTLVREVGVCKYVCDSYAFGDASIHWRNPSSLPALEPDATPDGVAGWLREAHRRLRDHLAALEDDTLLIERRPSYWDEPREIRWQVNMMIQHDLYHAGEINHIRALHQGND